MLNFRLNRLFVKSYISEEAYTSELTIDAKRLLAIVSYHFRCLYDRIRFSGYWSASYQELVEKMLVDDEVFDDACLELSAMGYCRIEPHGDELRFWIDVDKAIDKFVAEDIHELASTAMDRAVFDSQSDEEHLNFLQGKFVVRAADDAKNNPSE